MKKILFILISGIFTITSCMNMLDLYPISSSTKENSYTKPEDFTQLLNSVYAFSAIKRPIWTKFPFPDGSSF